jgi:hypothetical protein
MGLRKNRTVDADRAVSLGMMVVIMHGIVDNMD